MDYEYKNPQPVVLWGNDTKELKKYSSSFNNFIFYVENDEDSFSSFLERHSIKNGLVEGGNSILSYFLNEDMIDEFYYFKSSDSLESGLKIDKTIDEPYGTTEGRAMQQFFGIPLDKVRSKIDRAEILKARKKAINMELGEL